MTGCLACDAGFETKMMTLSVDIPANPGAPKRKADIVRKAPGNCIYAYLRQRDKGQISYQVVLVSLSQWSFTLAKEKPKDFIRIAAHDYLGHVFKRGTKFFPMLPDGRVRCKGSSSLKKATSWLYLHRGRG